MAVRFYTVRHLFYAVAAITDPMRQQLAQIRALLNSCISRPSVFFASDGREMGSRAQQDVSELKEDILNCRDLWALFDKWLGPAKAFKLGQITYRIFTLAREMGIRGTERGQGSAIPSRVSTPLCLLAEICPSAVLLTHRVVPTFLFAAAFPGT